MKTYTPLRYPGGKAKTYNEIVKLLEINNLIGCTYVEAYAGGLGLALKLLSNNKVSKLIVNDIDYNLYTFWSVTLNKHDELVNLIKKCEITLEERLRQKEIYRNPLKYSDLEVAFSFLYLNRTNRSGILKGGPIYKDDSKLGLRFNKEYLISLITEISKYRNRIKFYNLDAIEFLKKIVSKQKKDTFIFLDPPYYKKGPGLYTNFYKHQDHVNLYNQVIKLKSDKRWIVTYDDCDEVKEIYKAIARDEYGISYTAQVKRKEKELIFFSNNLIKVDMNKHP